MAIKVFERYGPRANPADSNYPNGSFKNESVPGANDGTPLEVATINDLQGFTDALLAEAGIPSDGNPDTATVSQRLEAFKGLFDRTFINVDDMIAYNGHAVGLKYAVAGTTFTPTTSSPVVAGDFDALDDVYPEAFGAISDQESGAQIQAASDYCTANNASLKFNSKLFQSSIPLTFDCAIVDFNGAAIEYTGAFKQFAVTINGADTAFDPTHNANNLIIINKNATEPDSTTLNKSVTLPAVAPAKVVTAIGGSTAPTVSVPFAGALVGDMITFDNYTLSSDEVVLTGTCEVDGVVIVHVNNWDQLSMYAGEIINVDITAIHNPLHGLCIGGGLINAKGIRVIGFTGLSVGTGDGLCPYSGVNLPGNSRAFYCNVEVQVSMGAGYGMEVPARNNRNTFVLNTFPYNLYGDTIPRRNNCINQMIVGGTNNTWAQRLSLEASSSKESIIVAHWANAHDFGDIYYEESPSWAANSSFMKLESTSSGCEGRGRGFKTDVDDLGVTNDIDVVANNYVNGEAKIHPVTGNSLIYNGDFEDGLEGWNQFGSATFDGVVTGYAGSNAVRFTLAAQTLNLSQPLTGLAADEKTAVSCWVRTDVAGVDVRRDGVPIGATSLGTGEWEFIGSAVRGGGSLQVRADSNTGFIEVSYVTATLGKTPLSVPVRTDPERSYAATVASIPANGVYSEVVTFEGVDFTDKVLVGIAENTHGAIITAAKTAADTITVTFFNPTGSPIISIGGTTIYITLIKSKRF